MAIPFLNNIIIDDAGHLQFKTAAGANAGKIDQDGDNLVLSNAVGDIIIGNGSDDVYIGDGTNAVDIRFEQNMAIYADSSSTRNLTLGGANTNLILESPTINGSLTLPATTINNKLTFGTANGYILFDYEPSGDTGAYDGTTSVPLLKVDRSGSEMVILERVSEYGALLLGNDDSVIIAGGDTRTTLRNNITESDETVIVSAEGGMKVIGFPNNMSGGWSARQEFRFYTGGSDAASNGLWIGSGGNTQFIDLSRNLKNIGTISSGAITSTGNIATTASNATISAAESGGATTKIMGASVGRVGTSTEHNLEILSNNTAAITIDTSQRVGIGTAPASGVELHVNGEVRVDSTSGVATRKIRSGYFSSTTDIVVASGSGASVRLQNGTTDGLVIDSSQNSKFTGNITAGPSATTGGRILSQTYTSADRLGVISSHASSGNLLIGYGAEGKTSSSGNFVSTYGNFEGGHSALSISGTQLTWYSEASNSTTAVGNDLTLANVFSVDRSGNVALSGTVDGVDIATRDALMVTTSGGQTISGAKNFTNVANQFNGHLYFNAYDANGQHYPHFRDGSNSAGADINWRHYYGSSNYKTHQWTSDSSGNMAQIFQGRIEAVGELKGTSLDINGNADISGTLAVGQTTINSGSDNILTLNQTSTDNLWNYIDFESQADRKWFLGMDADGNFDLYNDNINAYAITVGYTNNHINLKANTVVEGTLDANTLNTGQGDNELYAMNQNVRTTDDVTFDNLTVTGNLSITGDINSYNVTDLDVEDKTITVGVGQNAANSGSSGLIINRSDSTNPSMLWNQTDGRFEFNAGVTVSGQLHTTGSVYAKGSLFVIDTDGTNSHIQARSNGTEGYLTVSNGSNWGFIVRGPGNDPRIGAWHGGTLKIEGFHSSDGATGSNAVDLAQFKFADAEFNVNGDITLTGTVDGRNIANDGTKLDTIDQNADVTPSWVPSTNPNYLTSSGTVATANNLQGFDDRDMAPEDLSYSDDLKLFFSAKEGLEDGTSTGSDWHDVLVLNSYSDSSGGSANVLAFDKNSMKIRHYQAALSASNWGTAKELAYTDTANMLNSNVTLASLGAAASSHNHDDRYYTETEIDNFGFLTSSSTQSKYLRSDADDNGTGVIKLTQNNSTTPYPLIVQNISNGNGVGIEFDDNLNGTQRGYITHFHSDSKSYGSGASIILGTTESTLTVLADGKLMYNEGIYSKPSSGTGAGTRKDQNWDTAYGWGNHASEGYLTSVPNHSAALLTSGTLPTARLPEFIEEKYIYTSNDSNAVFMPMVKGGMYATQTSTVTGAILIKIPSYKSNMMQQFYVDIYEYDTGETMTFKISGYNYNNTDASWYNTSVVNLSDDNDRDFTVRFGANTSSSYQYVQIGETDSTWSYPQVNVRDFYGGYSTAESEALAAFDVSFVTSSPGTASATHTNNFPAADSARVLKTARTLTIGSTGKTFNGGANVSWTLAEIGAQASGNYITGSGSLSAQDLTDIGNLSGTNTGDQDISGIATNATAISNITSFPGFGTSSGTALEGDTSLFSGDYDDLSNKPTIPSGNAIIDWTTNQGSTNIHTGNYNNTQLSDSEVIAAVVASTNISSEDQGTIRSNIGAGSSSFSGAYNDLTGKPTLLELGTSSTTALAGNTTIPSGNSVIDWTADHASETIHSGNITGVGSVLSLPSPANGIEIDSGNTNASAVCVPLRLFQNGTSNESIKFVIDSSGSSDAKNRIISDSNDDNAQFAISLTNAGGTEQEGLIVSRGVGVKLGVVNEIGSDTNKFLMVDDQNGNVIEFVTGPNLRSYIGAGTSNLALGTTSTTALAGNTTTITSSQADAITANSAKTGISSAQSQKLSYITVTQAVDLDSIETRANNGHTAYGWGDHADGGYLTSFDITTQTDSKYIRSNANDTVSAHTEWQDSKQARFGNDADMKIQHTGTHAYIDNNTGDLYIRNNVNADVGGNIYLRPHDNEHGITIEDDAGVKLYYNNSQKMNTTSAGISVTGTVVASSTIGNKGTNIGQQIEYGSTSVATLRCDADRWRVYFGGGGQSREAFTIEETGDVGIGDSTPSYKLDVNGTIRATGDVIAYSDERVKENIKTIDNSLEKVNKLRGVEFNKIGEDKKSIGVIAQEIEKILPEVVRTDDEGMKSVAYGNVVGILIEAVKELTKEVEDLKKRKNCNCNA